MRPQRRVPWIGSSCRVRLRRLRSRAPGGCTAITLLRGRGTRLTDRSRGLVLARIGAGQDERYLRAGPRRALEFDGAARLTRETIDLRKAETGMLRRVARREERLERARGDLARHAGALIADRDGDILA